MKINELSEVEQKLSSKLVSLSQPSDEALQKSKQSSANKGEQILTSLGLNFIPKQIFQMLAFVINL